MVDDTMEMIRTQLTVARWHLDAAIGAAHDAARSHHELARVAYHGVVRILARASGLDADQRAQIEQELAMLRSRLQLP